MPSVEAPNAWIDSRMPERTRNVPRIARMPAPRISDTFHILSIPRFSCTIAECRNAVPISHGISDAFSTASQPQYPPQPSSEYDQRAPSTMPTPRHSQAASAKGRVVRSQSASRRRVISAPIGERERDREQRVPRVQHRRVEHHRRVAQQRVQPEALGRHRAGARERRLEEDQQAAEEGREPEQHGGRVGGDLARPPPGEEQDRARPHAQQQHPQQEGSLLGRPDRGRPVERRRRRGGVRGDQLRGEVRAQERQLEQQEADGQGARQRIDRAAPGVDPGPPASSPRCPSAPSPRRAP